MRNAAATALVLIGLAVLVSGVPACGDGEPADASASPGSPAATPPAARPASTSSGRRPGERPLPAFSGRTLDGAPFSVSSYIGKRLVLFFFNPEVDEAVPMARAIAAISPQQGKYNFQSIGVAVGSSRAKALGFVQQNGLDIPIVDDSAGQIGAKLKLGTPVAVLGVDSEGYFAFALGAVPADMEGAPAMAEAQLREKLRIPEAGAEELSLHPRAPLFSTERLDGGEPFRMAELAGKPVVLVFFLHTCPHCHAALAYLKEQLEALPEDRRPPLIGISLQNRPTSVRQLLREQELDFFPVLVDPESQVQQSYGVFGAVPVVLLIDGKGNIARRVDGWREDRDPALVRMTLAKIAGVQVPMLLNPRGYTGSDVCGVCHELEYETWQLTSHASAFDTLVTHGSDRDGECVSCHVVGFEQPGGFSLSERPPHLENVGCESCHGRGGPHLTPDFVADGSYEKACLTCHNATHSLGFDYATFRPKISHEGISALSPEERKELVASHGKLRDVLPTGADYVGSDACRSCHEAEFTTWSKSPHAKAVATLALEGQESNSDCLKCHTTAFGRTGGFPSGAEVAGHSDLARVGCESCHGPGGDHVGAGAKRVGTIVSLADKCDSCVILQICGSCHDDANDPGFEFEVDEKIEAQRHGTIEAGTGKPLGDTAGARSARPEEELAQAFRLLEGAPAAGTD